MMTKVKWFHLHLSLNLVAFILLFYSFAHAQKKSDFYDHKHHFYEKTMRDFVMNMSMWAKSIKPNFHVIVMDGFHLFQPDKKSKGKRRYYKNIDGVIIHRPMYPLDHFASHMIWAKKKGVVFFGAADAFSGDSFSFRPNVILKGKKRIVGFEEERLYLKSVKNYNLYLKPISLNEDFNFFKHVSETNWDMLVIDPFVHPNYYMTTGQLGQLKYNNIGTGRLVFAYINIASINKKHSYWKKLKLKNRKNKLSYIPHHVSISKNRHIYPVYYWEKKWQKIFFGTPESYLGSLIQMGFDGVVIDGVDEDLYWKRF